MQPIPLFHEASCQIRKIARCACAGNAGNVSSATDFKGSRWLAIPACITARASRTLRGKRSRHSRRMRNPQFYVSDKRPWRNPKRWLRINFSDLMLMMMIKSKSTITIVTIETGKLTAHRAAYCIKEYWEVDLIVDTQSADYAWPPFQSFPIILHNDDKMLMFKQTNTVFRLLCNQLLTLIMDCTVEFETTIICSSWDHVLQNDAKGQCPVTFSFRDIMFRIRCLPRMFRWEPSS